MGLYQRTSGGGNASDRRILEAHNGVHLDDGYSEEMEYKAAALSEDMTVFPAEGSIVEEKDLVVVKLSEITERPAVDWW